MTIAVRNKGSRYNGLSKIHHCARCSEPDFILVSRFRPYNGSRIEPPTKEVGRIRQLGGVRRGRASPFPLVINSTHEGWLLLLGIEKERHIP
jgi:hypothetical protein